MSYTMQTTQCLLYLFLVYVALNNVSSYNWQAVDYYEKLIKENIEAAESYEIPANNAEFLGGFQSTEIKDAGSYDFIIVGAGSAGSVVATRLSEIDDWKILLLEAGGEESDFSRIPSMMFYLTSSNMSWGYHSTPQKHCCFGMKNNRVRLPKGKLIGGSSSINGLQYVRGNAKNYDEWAEMGISGWSFADVFPYFIKSENSQVDGEPGYHAKGGVLNIEHGYINSIKSVFYEANKELGRQEVDFNGRVQLGYSKSQATMKEGRRQSTGTAFLGGARKRKNLKVITRALATKIIFDRSKKTAEGIVFVTDKGRFIAHARKEVIVSAGAVNSPQLLMLSGIGPRNHLNQLNIPVIADLPVGKRLQDHPLMIMYFHTNQVLEGKDLRPKIQSYLEGTGPLTTPVKVEGLSFINVGNTTKNLPTFEIMLFSPSGAPIMAATEKLYNFNEEVLNNFISKVSPTNDFLIYLILLDEKSKGVLTLKSSNPLDFPNIDVNYLEEYEDIKKITEGIRHVLKLSQTKAFRRIGTTLVDYGICNNVLKYSDQYWECVIRHIATTTHHLSGTTVMGTNPLTSVVNANLEVHGVGKLRVVDASIFPTSIAAHTNAPTIMVGEKGSDMIKRKHNRLDCRLYIGSPSCPARTPTNMDSTF